MRLRWGTALGSLPVAVVVLFSAGCGDEGQASAADGKAVFTKAGCGTCHTLRDAGATGAVGVDFDETKPNELKVEVFVRNGSPPTMPSFEGTLSEDEIKAVAAYVSEASGGNEE